MRRHRGQASFFCRARSVTTSGGVPWVIDSGVNYGAEGDGPFLYLQDPEGNGLELKGPPLS